MTTTINDLSARSPKCENTYSFFQKPVDASSECSIFKDRDKHTLTPIANDQNMNCHELVSIETSEKRITSRSRSISDMNKENTIQNTPGISNRGSRVQLQPTVLETEAESVFQKTPVKREKSVSSKRSSKRTKKSQKTLLGSVSSKILKPAAFSKRSSKENLPKP